MPSAPLPKPAPILSDPATPDPAPKAAAPPPPVADGPPARSSPVRSPRDMAAGLLFVGVGLASLWIGRDWDTGTLASVQAGFFPHMISVLMALFGAIVTGQGLMVRGERLSGWAWRPLVGVTVAVLAFAATLETLGLVAAVLLLVGLGNFAGQPLKPLPLAVLGGLLVAGCVAIFVWGLGLPMKVWPL